MSDNSKKIRIQTVIINLDYNGVLRLLNSIEQAVGIWRKKYDGSATVCIGDMSDGGNITEKQVAMIERNFAESTTSFEYKHFEKNSRLPYIHNCFGLDCDDDYILVVDENIILEPACLKRLYEKLEKNANASLAEARQTPVEYQKEYNDITGVTDWTTMICTLIRKDKYREVGGFDDTLFGYYMYDVDLSWRIRVIGAVALYVPEAIVFRYGMLKKSPYKNRFVRSDYYYTLDKLLLYKKWSGNAALDRYISDIKDKGNDQEKEACDEFEKIVNSSDIIKEIRDNNKVARFYDGEMALLRY